MCFFGHDEAFEDPTANRIDSGAKDANNVAFYGNRLIQYDQGTLKTRPEVTTSHPLYGYTGPANTIGFGIPTGAIIDDFDAGASDIPDNDDSKVWNLYFASGTQAGNTGKTHPASEDMVPITDSQAIKQRQMAYWGVLGASRSWWASDLIAIQNNVAASDALDKTSIIAV